MVKNEVRSEITGAVWEVKKCVGDTVSEGETIAMLESMKMEIPVLADATGTIIELLVAVGDTVDEGQVVAVLECE